MTERIVNSSNIPSKYDALKFHLKLLPRKYWNKVVSVYIKAVVLRRILHN